MDIKNDLTPSLEIQTQTPKSDFVLLREQQKAVKDTEDKIGQQLLDWRRKLIDWAEEDGFDRSDPQDIPPKEYPSGYGFSVNYGNSERIMIDAGKFTDVTGISFAVIHRNDKDFENVSFYMSYDDLSEETPDQPRVLVTCSKHTNGKNNKVKMYYGVNSDFSKNILNTSGESPESEIHDPLVFTADLIDGLEKSRPISQMPPRVNT